MKLAAFSFESGEWLNGLESSTWFDRSVTKRGIEVYYDDDD